MIKNILVLGAGSAGLIAAISLARKIPQVTVRVVRSPELGVIGVGEGTTPNFPRHLFEYLGISRKRFYALAEPTWKLGIRFLWGPRGRFDYTFDQQLDSHWSDLPMPNGYYCDEEFRCASVPSALMWHGKAFPRQATAARTSRAGTPFTSRTRSSSRSSSSWRASMAWRSSMAKSPAAIGCPRAESPRCILEDGRRLEADFFIDCSGFRSELLGKALAEPFVSFDRSLFCDRAVVGGWERTG